MTESLDPISPEEALNMYLREREPEVASSTLSAHEYRLQHLVRWCAHEGLDNLNHLSGRDLHRYKIWRRDDGDLNQVSLKTQMDTLRVFIRWCESIDAVEPGLAEKVLSPTLDTGEDQRDVLLEVQRAEEIIEHLRCFHYASFDHVVMALLWHTGIRVGAARALDVDDFDQEADRLRLRHRHGTPLKNKEQGQRMIALASGVSTLLNDWLIHNRPDVEDDHGRQPLIASEYGRPHVSTFRAAVYRWTKPCRYGDGCPHDSDPETCEARQGSGYGALCPSTVSAHAVRRGAITHFLTEDVPEKVVSDRMNVSREVLDAHYDRRSEEIKVEQRREFLEGV